MPPASIAVPAMQLGGNRTQVNSSASELRQQWLQPRDVISVLLLVGGDVVNKALAQLAGSGLTPVTFSFGWVSYAVTALFVAGAGEVKLMPTTLEIPSIVITAKNGYVRSNISWIIDRILRDYESWMDPAVRKKLDNMLDERQLYMRRITKKGTLVPRPGHTGLCIAIYEPSRSKTAGEPTRDLMYWSGLAVALVQSLIAAIPIVTSGDWSNLMITGGGTILAFITGSLPQWRAEKWACRRSSPNTYILTRGNGAQHAIMIVGNGRGLNLEDLAVAGQTKYRSSNLLTRLCLTGITFSWIALLITAAGKATNTWYLLVVGGIGMLQNVLVVGWRRDPSALGVHLEFQEVVGKMTAMDALLALEAKYTNAGRSLLPIFFPGKLLPEEIRQWSELEVKAAQEKEHARSRAQNNPTNGIAESWTAHARTYERV